MSKNSVYGIASLKLTSAVANAFPTTWAGFSLNAIVKDSFKPNDSAPSDTDIEVEDMETAFVTLPNSIGTKGFTVDTYDLSNEAYTYLMGWAAAKESDTANAGWLIETPNYQLPNQAVQLTTKAYGDIPSWIFEWANMKVTVVQAGTIGKSGLPNLTLTFKKQPLFDASGLEIAGARKKKAA